MEKNSMGQRAFCLTVLACLAAVRPSAGRAAEAVRTWEEKLVLPTYLVEPAEPNPIFFAGRAYQGAKGPIYPYPALDRLTDTKRDVAYRAVYLENEFVKICLLPEIGGRIFSAVDKTNGYDFVYRQHVVKPALIGMLGAWISGGVEWNIPHHHRATSFMPVDHALVRNRDGSVTAWVGEVELRHRTKWLVGLTLRPGSAVLDVDIRIINRTPLAHSQLAFANVAVHANPDYQVIFPPDAEIATFHGKNQFSRWPVFREIFNGQDYTAGIDVSWWKSHARPTSFFAFEAKGDYLAGYDHGREAGVAFIYSLGVALRRLDRPEEADEAFSRAAWCQPWQSASFFGLAELAAGRGDFDGALEFVGRALAANADNTTALGLKAALLRKMGRTAEAEKAAAEALAVDAMDFRALNELLLSNTAAGLREDTGMVFERLRSALRDAPANHLELAADYASAGLWDEASGVLARLVEAKLTGASDFALVHYFLGYCLARKGDKEKAEDTVLRAATLSPDYVFPYQSECLDVFRWASGANPRDAKAPYYLGNFLFDLQPEEALKEWERSVALDGGYSVARRNLGLAFARVRNDVPRAVAELKKAVALAPQDPRLYFELDQLLEAAGAPPEKRLAVLEANHGTVSKRDDALAREIHLLVQLGRYGRALEILGSRRFHAWEGGGEIYGVFVEAHLGRGRAFLESGRAGEALRDFEAASTYPRNLDVAPPDEGGGSAKVHYWIGLARETMGDKEGANAAFAKAASFRHAWSEPSYYRGLAERKLGREAEAEKIFEGLVRFASERLKAAPAMDFFEKFGEWESALRQGAQMHFVLGLGRLGEGRPDEAKAEFRKSLELNPNHLGAAGELARLH
ncbi:MAG: DUF5107 domain-containing protein [Candidatus Aminicenantes bacterium]|nr:DUF5107 domain-containing protein [Candidatus Aminicenantes bacterium]